MSQSRRRAPGGDSRPESGDKQTQHLSSARDVLIRAGELCAMVIAASTAALLVAGVLAVLVGGLFYLLAG